MSTENGKNEYERFLSGYANGPSVQDAAEALYDSQIRSIVLVFAEHIGKREKGSVLDIGCGKGIILKRLAQEAVFVDRPRWLYIGADFDDFRDIIGEQAWSLRLNRRVDFIELSEVYANWVPKTVAPRPLVIVVRNVFHELDLEHTTRLLWTLNANVSSDDTIIIQDLLVMPNAEDYVCWHPDIFADLVTQCGFKITCVQEMSPTGIRWLSAVAAKTRSMAHEQISAAVTAARIRQWDLWEQAGGFFEAGPHGGRNEDIALADFRLQQAALMKQLLEAGVASISPPTAEYENQIAKAALSRQLRSFDLTSLTEEQVPVDHIRYFRNRGRNQSSLEAFLQSRTPVAVIRGGSYYGKTVLVREVLNRRAHRRHVMFIDAEHAFSVWSLIERYLSEANCVFSYSLLSAFQHLRYDDIEEPLAEFCTSAARHTVVVFDHFEKLLDPNGVVLDEDIRQFLELISVSPDAKVIITSRRPVNLHYLGAETIDDGHPLVGRFPDDVNHVANILRDFVEPSELGLDEYPSDLIEAIDRHPYLTFVTAQILKHEGRAAIGDEALLEQLRGRLRSELIMRIATPACAPLLEVMSLIRVPVPQSLLEHLAGEVAVQEALHVGLAYLVPDRHSSDLVKLIGPLRPLLYTDEVGFESEDDVPIEARQRELHRKLAEEFWAIHHSRRDPRWIREFHYHSLASGNRGHALRLGSIYSQEIFGAGERWFRAEKDFRAALDAFQLAEQLGLRTYLTSIRIAGCLVRLGDLAAGMAKYESALNLYPGKDGIKMSFVDSLLYVREYGLALQKLEEFGLRADKDAWVAGQWGRAYLGLSRYSEAIRAFRQQLDGNKEASVYRYLARSYIKNGSRDGAQDTLLKGLRLHPHDFRLCILYANHLIRNGEVASFPEAEARLMELHQRKPHDGAVLQQLCKLLCLTGRQSEARALLDKINWDVYPAEMYLRPIRVEIYLGEERWADALSELKAVDSHNESLVGLKKKVYMWWAQHQDDESAAISIARDGLDVPMDASLNRNIPILVTSARLARLAQDQTTHDRYIALLRQVNAQVADAITDETEEAWGYYFEEMPL